MAKDLKLKWDSPRAIRSDLLDTFPYKGERQRISYTTNEFSSVCPFSGLPDIARVTIDYLPDGKCIELKSLKLYFVSFRNVGIYQEEATQRIYRDLYRKMKPAWLRVTTVYNTRGGIDASCVIDSAEE